MEKYTNILRETHNGLDDFHNVFKRIFLNDCVSTRPDPCFARSFFFFETLILVIKHE